MNPGYDTVPSYDSEDLLGEFIKAWIKKANLLTKISESKEEKFTTCNQKIFKTP